MSVTAKKWIWRIILFLLAAVLVFLAVRFIMKEKEQKEHNDIMIQNCTLFHKQYGNLYQIANMANKDETPQKPIHYVVIRRVDGNDMIIAAELETGKTVSEEWTKDDIQGIDAAVYVSSHVGSADYKVNGTGNTVSAKYEDVELYYYNTQSKKCFASDTINHQNMPETAKYVNDKTISNPEIAETVQNTISNLTPPETSERNSSTASTPERSDTYHSFSSLFNNTRKKLTDNENSLSNRAQ